MQNKWLPPSIRKRESCDLAQSSFSSQAGQEDFFEDNLGFDSNDVIVLLTRRDALILN